MPDSTGWPRHGWLPFLVPAITAAAVIPFIMYRITVVDRLAKSENIADGALAQATQLQTMFADSANDMHAYLLTGSKPFLDAYLSTEQAIHGGFHALGRFTSTQPDDRAVFRAIQAAYVAWHAQADAAIDVRLHGGRYPPASMIFVGTQRMKALRDDAEILVQRERSERAAESEAATRAARDAMISAAVGVVLIVGALLYGTRQTLIERQRRADEMRAERDQLELERRRTRELHAEKQRIEEAARLKSRFVANMSHELRTPLTAILGLGEMLLDEKAGPQNERQKRYLEDILSSGRHLLRLINNVLDLAKMEAGTLELSLEAADPSALVEEVVEVLKPLAQEKTIGVSTEFDRAPARILTDPFRFRQILYNFLANAIKFTPAGGKVRVLLARANSGGLRLEVSDTGIGIADADLDKLFVEFSQVDGGVAKRHEGAGLGLALTKRLVSALGGSVGVRSAVGLGSTFYAILPAAVPAAESGRKREADVVASLAGR